MSTRIVFVALAWVALGVAAPLTAQDRVEKLLEELTNAPGVPSHEGEVRKIVLREMGAIGAEISTDGLGSAIGLLRGPADGPRIMLAAHMDELGLLVKYVTGDGYVKFLPLGGWFDQALVDKAWIIHTAQGPVPGVTGIKNDSRLYA